MPGAIILSQELIKEIHEYHLKGHGARYTAKQLGITRHRVMKAYKILGLDVSNKQNPRKPIPKEKECIKCHNMKKIGDFRRRKRTYESICKQCESEVSSERYRKNRQWYADYKRKNRKHINAYRKNKINTDINFKLRIGISSSINSKLRNIGKKGRSCMTFLPYTIEELKAHLEAQFEPWMTWGNWGPYRAKIWKDNDRSTWTWQIDHIIPAIKFNYKSIEDEDFVRCWALTNLRPYSAKKNIKDGHRRKTI